MTKRLNIHRYGAPNVIAGCAAKSRLVVSALSFLLVLGLATTLKAEAQNANAQNSNAPTLPPVVMQKVNVQNLTTRDGALSDAALDDAVARAQNPNFTVPNKSVSSKKSVTSSTRNKARRIAGAPKKSVVKTLMHTHQNALLGGAAGLFALVFGVVAFHPARRRVAVKTIQPSNIYSYGYEDEIARLRARIEAQRLRQKEIEDLVWQMTANANDVLFVMCPSDNSIHWHGQIDALLGYAANAFPRTIEGWAEQIHPEESENIVALYVDSCRGNCDFKVEYRIARRDGTYRDWLHRGRPVYDEGQNFLYLVGACVDVTERNQLQKRLRESETERAMLREENEARDFVSQSATPQSATPQSVTPQSVTPQSVTPQNVVSNSESSQNANV